jgi:chromosome segregation ATPase
MEITWRVVGLSLKALLEVSASFALITLSISALFVASQAKKTLRDIDDSVSELTRDATDLKKASNAVLEQTKQVLQHTNEVLIATSTAQTVQVKKVNLALDELNLTIKNLDANQVKITQDIHNTALTIPPVIDSTKRLLSETQNTMAQTTVAIKTLNDLEVNAIPTVKHINETTEHLNNISASLDTIVKEATKPKPWYKKMFGYVWAPIKIVAMFAK